MASLSDHPLRRLDGLRLAPHALRLARLEPGEKSGWTRFHLALTGKEGDFSPSVVEGIHSAGGRGVLPWIEVLSYEPQLQRGKEMLDLTAKGLDRTLFAALAELIPPGGHLMVGCETPPHQATYQALMKRVPPAATPLGERLFRAGFRKVKFFYLAEGGWEGQQKLWAEKPLDEAMQRAWDTATLKELDLFISAPTSDEAAQACLPRARALLEELRAAS